MVRLCKINSIGKESTITLETIMPWCKVFSKLTEAGAMLFFG